MDYTKRFDFIETACIELDYSNGDLVSVINETDWQHEDKIDWIKLCESVNEYPGQKTEKIFFVNDEPLIIFTKAHTAEGLYKIYNQIWCMARPRLLFLETLSELIVLDLAKRPLKDDKELVDNALVIVKSITEISNQLIEYRREQIESGRIFEDEKFSNIECRADRALIRDLKIVRNRLYNAGLSGSHIKYAHALIGKSIFLRYLEDRGILTKQYFLKIANSNTQWVKLIQSNTAKASVDSKREQFTYPKILGNKKFTYKLFKEIAKDFNGDIFPTDDLEEKVVTQDHLTILQNFLYGDVNDQTLFFWAYHFDIIPIELISNIYEEFYHYNTKEFETDNGAKLVDNKGTYYTPSPLVEFVLRRTLSEDILRKKPIVVDPACGSGIFLVETYRKIVRFELFANKKKKLSRTELLSILQRQIRGIELNEEAVKITAFSLYLAFLHYQTPPDILVQIKKGKRLPHLIVNNRKRDNEEYFDILLHSNAFEINNHHILNRFGTKCAHVVVGNPPWGSPPKDDNEGRLALKSLMDWCKERQYPTSDKERSQAFIWRALDLLKDNGVAGMLVSSGVLLKQSEKSNIFKQAWINSATLREVVNFVHVRDVFFNGAISPFLSVLFEKKTPSKNSLIDYWTARRTKIIEHTKAIILDKTDFKFFSFAETAVDDIWKIFYFGNHRDLSLISKLRLCQELAAYEYTPATGQARRQGFIEGNKKLKSDWLQEYKELPAQCFNDRYDIIPFNKVLVDVPTKVKERGAKHIYEGKRILIGKVSQKSDPKGQLIARIENRKFSFRNTINCIKLKEEFADFYEVILGIMWSSLSRYYFFLTSSKWGVWHDQVYADEILKLPINLPNNKELKIQIETVVGKLRNREFIKPRTAPIQSDLFSVTTTQPTYNKTLHELEMELDKYVFQLYNLTEAEIDLIKDRCELDIDFFYNDSQSLSVSNIGIKNSESGDLTCLSSKRSSLKGLEEYLYTFINLWTKEIDDKKKMVYRIVYPPGSPLIAAVFEAKNKNYNPSPIKNVNSEWENILTNLSKNLTHQYSDRIYIDGIVRVYTDNLIIIIKRDEYRLWTRTAAREDVDATILQAILKQETLHA